MRQGFWLGRGKSDKHPEVVFRETPLEEIAGSPVNPGRGWYQLYSFDLREPISPEELKWSLDSREGVALVQVDIGGYRNDAIDQKGLDNLKEILAFFGRAKKDIVIRPVYDREGKGLEKEPAFFSQVLEHMRQIGEVLAQHNNGVVAMQGLLVGNWGEMHGSRYLTEDHLRRLAGTWMEATGGKCRLAVRKPSFWRTLSPEEEWKDWSKREYRGQIGLFDDAIFASKTHLGTFGNETAAKAGWQSGWSPEEEMSFVKWLGSAVPCGGEAVCPEEEEDLQRALNPASVIGQLSDMHVTYLNRIYDSRLLERWQQISCEMDGIWRDVSLYDYVGAHLGYRFVVRRVELVTEKKGKKMQNSATGHNPGSGLWLELEIENSGFASAYVPMQLWLEKGGERILFSCDPGEWKSGSSYLIRTELPQSWIETTKENQADENELYLKLMRVCDGQVIDFANAGIGGGRLLLGNLHRL